MPPLGFDFRTERRVFSRLGAGLLILGLAALAVVAWRLRDVTRQTESLRWQIAAHAPRPAPVVPVAESTQARHRTQAQAEVMHHLNFVWQPVFAALEGATQSKIALLSVDCQPTHFTLSAEALTLPDALNYVARLNRSPGLVHVLLRHYKVEDSDPQQPVRFELQGGIAP